MWVLFTEEDDLILTEEYVLEVEAIEEEYNGVSTNSVEDSENWSSHIVTDSDSDNNITHIYIENFNAKFKSRRVLQTACHR